MNEIEVRAGQLQLTEQVENLFEQKRQIEIQRDQIDTQIKELEAALIQAMGEHGVKKFENDKVSITYVAPGKRESVDTAKLKEDGMYDFYKKESPVKASVRWKWKTDEQKEAMHTGLYDQKETF